VSSVLVEEAVKKAAIAWVAVAGGPARGLWCMPSEGSLVVVIGPGEQALPELAAAERAEVRLRGDTGGLIVVWTAVVTRIAPGTDEWADVAPQLAAKRLNASGSTDELVARWAETGCTVVRLTPADEDPIAASGLPDDEQAAPPRETPARVEVHHPRKLHRVRKAKR
jgi:hypothetical protein